MLDGRYLRLFIGWLGVFKRRWNIHICLVFIGFGRILEYVGITSRRSVGD